MDPGKVRWMEVDEAYVRHESTNNRIPQAEYLAALASFDDVPTSMQQCAFIAAHIAHRPTCRSIARDASVVSSTRVATWRRRTSMCWMCQ
jgi:hypothetical protein